MSVNTMKTFVFESHISPPSPSCLKIGLGMLGKIRVWCQNAIKNMNKPKIPSHIYINFIYNAAFGQKNINNNMFKNICFCKSPLQIMYFMQCSMFFSRNFQSKYEKTNCKQLTNVLSTFKSHVWLKKIWILTL